MADKKEIDDIIAMIDKTMEGGVSRLSVGTSEELDEGSTRKLSHHGRCDVGSPWADGRVSACDIEFTAEDEDKA